VRTDGLTEEEQDRLRLATKEYDLREKVNYQPYKGKAKRSWGGREKDYIADAQAKAIKLGYKDVGDRMLNDAQYAMRMSIKPRWSPGYSFIKATAIAVIGADFMTGADAYGEVAARSLTDYAIAVEVPWFRTLWTTMLVIFISGCVAGNFQNCLLRVCWRFFKRGLGYEAAGREADPRLRTVGTQSQTNYDMSMTRFDTMRFVAQNQGFQRAGEVEVIYH